MYKFIIFKVVFVLFSLTVIAQSIFLESFNPIYIDNKSIKDIQNHNNVYVRPLKYLNTPNFAELSVSEKKIKFINFILPSILLEKNKIKKAYDYILNNYEIKHNNDTINELFEYCNCDTKNCLLLCLKAQPNSIIIAQAAIESGWGTSRFFIEGNNLFGVHTQSNDPNKIKAKNSSPVYVKKYNSISESISHYLRTLASGYFYEQYRINRFNNINSIDLINYLSMYSIRRESYIEDLNSIIIYNNLLMYDNLELIYD
ncbi:MAG: hypothetical protein CMP65_00840 [Flavobacteriales bacterium]|nr:hypothetical protein [Flavobacteriales bacterium]